jgi:sugar phosphate isomerase/epimerase
LNGGGILKVSLSNGAFSQYALEENIASVKALGFENLEFNMKCVEEEDEDSVYIAKKLLDSYGLNCLTLHAACLNVKNEKEIPRAIYYGKVSADFASKLSASVLVVHSDISERLPENLRSRSLIRIFQELNPYAKNLNLRLALENLSYRSVGYGKTVSEIEEILHIINSDGAMGITLDLCHAEAMRQTSELFEKYKTRLCNVHVSQGRHRGFSKMTPKLCDFLTKLRQCGYDGPLTVELDSRCANEEIVKTRLILENSELL